MSGRCGAVILIAFCAAIQCENKKPAQIVALSALVYRKYRLSSDIPILIALYATAQLVLSGEERIVALCATIELLFRGEQSHDHGIQRICASRAFQLVHPAVSAFFQPGDCVIIMNTASL